jgi:hypothetical protein
MISRYDPKSIEIVLKHFRILTASNSRSTQCVVDKIDIEIALEYIKRIKHKLRQEAIKDKKFDECQDLFQRCLIYIKDNTNNIYSKDYSDYFELSEMRKFFTDEELKDAGLCS